MRLHQYTERILDIVLRNHPPRDTEKTVREILHLYQSVSDPRTDPTGPVQHHSAPISSPLGAGHGS